MRTELLMIIENLASGNKDNAIRYAELLIKNCEIEYRNNGDVLSKCDIGIAKNLLHILKGEPKEGDVAVLDSAKTVQEEKDEWKERKMKIHKCGECCQFKNCKCKEWNRDVSAERTACKLAYVNDYFGDHEIKKIMEGTKDEGK